MKPALSLKEIAEATYSRVKDKGTLIDWYKYLAEHKDHIWTICRGQRLCGMGIAKITAPCNLYVMELVTLWPGCFGEFINRVSEFFGPIRTLEFLRRGKLKRVNFEQFKRITNYE